MINWPVYHRIEGPIVIIGFGSIGRGALPLILRHFDCDKNRVTIIDPDDSHRAQAEEYGVNFKKEAITRENYAQVLEPMLTQGEGQGFLVNLSVDVSSLALMELCQRLKCLYIDTVIEPWPGFYDNRVEDLEDRSNYILRESLLKHRREHTGGTTAVSCCGANPGMVSWFVKKALINLADDLKIEYTHPTNRYEWAQLMNEVGVKGIHIAERDTQQAAEPKPIGTFVNTWSVDGFISEGLQPAELGWGTHEKSMPQIARTHKNGCGAAIYLNKPGASTRVRSWTPTAEAQHGFLVTHNESISIADYFTLTEGGKTMYRPTCHYAYHPCDDAVLSLHELRGSGWKAQKKFVLLDENEIVEGIDELGVLLYGHEKNAYWYGSQLSIEETRRIAPDQNATGLQVTSAVIAGMVWAIENPEAGIVEADEMDYQRCLQVQMPYLGPVVGVYSDWTPLEGRGDLFPEELDYEDPWQFTNILVA